MRLSDASYVNRSENIIITGATGVGKSYIATALGHQACQMGYRVAYFSAQKLFAMLRMSKADESYLKEIKQIERQNLLIIDDFGMQPLDQSMRMMLMEIIEDRHQEKSTIIASQIPVEKWHEIIGKSTIADAIEYFGLYCTIHLGAKCTTNFGIMIVNTSILYYSTI